MPAFGRTDAFDPPALLHRVDAFLNAARRHPHFFRNPLCADCGLRCQQPEDGTLRLIIYELFYELICVFYELVNELSLIAIPLYISI
jgi:hypothetical protein